MNSQILRQVPAGKIIGWYGASQVIGKSESALKMQYVRGKLPLNPQKIGRLLFFDLKELLSVREGLNDNS